jgi:hypothetical protein
MPKWVRVFLLCICAVVAVACTDLPDTHVYDRTASYQILNKEKIETIGKPDNQGRQFCSHLEAVSRDKSRSHRSAGWILGFLAFLFTALGAGLGACELPDNKRQKMIYRMIVVGSPVLAAACAHLSSGQFDMAANANSTAYAAASAVLLDDDRNASAACNTAIAAWNSNNSISNRAFTEKLLEVMKGEQRAPEPRVPSDGRTGTAPSPSPSTTPAAPDGNTQGAK